MHKKNEIVGYIKWRINSGVYQPNEKIPSEHSLVIKFNCARGTVRSALKVLIDEGYIVSKKSIGHFVSLSRRKLTIKPTKGKKAYQKFQVINMLKPTPTQKLGIERLNVSTKDLEEKFKYRFIKTYINEEEKPFTVIQSFLNTEVIGEIDEEKLSKSLSAFLVTKNIRIVKRNELALIQMPDQHISIKLMIGQKQLVPAVYSEMIDHKGNVVEVAIQYFIPSEFEMSKEVKY